MHIDRTNLQLKLIKYIILGLVVACSMYYMSFDSKATYAIIVSLIAVATVSVLDLWVDQ
jgi:hypothetical protein